MPEPEIKLEPFDPDTDPHFHQLVYCPTCDYARKIAVQNRDGTHGCMDCNGEMEVYEPRARDVEDMGEGAMSVFIEEPA